MTPQLSWICQQTTVISLSRYQLHLRVVTNLDGCKINWAAQHTCRRTYILPGFFLFFLLSFRQLPAELAERNSTKTGHMPGSKCDLKMHVRSLGYTLPVQIGGPKPLFSRISQLNRNYNGLYLRNKMWYRQSGIGVDNYKGSPISSQNYMNFDPQTA